MSKLASCCGNRRYWGVAVLFMINMLNYMDRLTLSGILSDLQKPVDCWKKTDTETVSVNHWLTKTSNSSHNKCCGFGITDSEGGFLQTTFIGGYMVFSPLFGYLGDRFNRPRLMSVGILIWSGATLAGSFAKTFTVLAIFRGIVGIGEASYATIAPTIIADMFTSERRMKMLIIYYLAVPIGSALGYIVGSNVAEATGNCWQWAFRVTPGLGVLFAIFSVMLIRDPPRGEAEHARKHSGSGKSGLAAYWQDVKEIVKVRSFIWSSLGFTSVTFVVGAMAQWAPTYVRWASGVENKDNMYTVAGSSFRFGVVTFCAGIAGSFLGGEIARRLGRRTKKANALVCGFAMLLSAPLIYTALTIAHIYNLLPLTWICIFLGILLLLFGWAPVSAILLSIIVPTRRATAGAIQIFCSHLLGDAFSPFVLGLVSDDIRVQFPCSGCNLKHLPAPEKATPQEISNEERALRYALYVNAFVAVLGGAAFLVASRYLPADMEKAEQSLKNEDDETEELISSGGVVPVAVNYNEPKL